MVTDELLRDELEPFRWGLGTPIGPFIDTPMLFRTFSGVEVEDEEDDDVDWLWVFRLGWTGVLDEFVAVDDDDEDDEGDGEDCMVAVSADAPVD